MDRLMDTYTGIVKPVLFW